MPTANYICCRSMACNEYFAALCFKRYAHSPKERRSRRNKADWLTPRCRTSREHEDNHAHGINWHVSNPIFHSEAFLHESASFVEAATEHGRARHLGVQKTTSVSDGLVACVQSLSNMTSDRMMRCSAEWASGSIYHVHDTSAVSWQSFSFALAPARKLGHDTRGSSSRYQK